MQSSIRDISINSSEMVVLPLGHCERLIRAIYWLGSGASCLTISLFLIRVNCVFFASRRAKMLFTSLWTLASLSLLCFPLSNIEIAQNVGGICVVSSLDRLRSIPSFTIGVFDMTIFISISYRITEQCTNRAWWERYITFFTGTQTGATSRALVRTGQLYFV